MSWLSILAALVLAFVFACVSAHLSFAWKRLSKRSESAAAIEDMLPGYDCSLCGYKDCRGYAAAVDTDRADPALCSPGGSAVETSLRELLSHRRGDPRSRLMRAVVRCGAGDAAMRDYRYEGHRSCHTASLLYGGPLRCKEGCIGLGSCVGACPLGAISLRGGVAVVSPSLCSGCGDCVPACPKGVISLVPADSEWYVACISHEKAEKKKKNCSAACVACGECSRLSSRFEFSVLGELARENPSVETGAWEEIAASCPTGAILRAGYEKNTRSSFRKLGR